MSNILYVKGAVSGRLSMSATLNVARTLLVFLTFDLVMVVILRVIGVTPILSIHVAVITNLLILYYGDNFILRATKARRVLPWENPAVFSLVEELAMKAKVPKPGITIISNPAPNVFTIGRSPKHATLCLHSGLLEILDKEQLEGVLGHEFAHLKNWGFLANMTAATMASIISHLGQLGCKFVERRFRGRTLEKAIRQILFAIFAPLAVVLIRIAVPENMEYLADKEGAKISGKPGALAAALQKMERLIQRHPLEGNPATSHLYIVDPFRDDKWAEAFSRHPSMDKRIMRLGSVGDCTGANLINGIVKVNRGDAQDSSFEVKI